MTSIVHAQCFQFLIYSKKIEKLLILINQVRIRKSDYNVGHDIMTCLTNFQGIVQEVNECFSSSLLMNYFALYASILVNLNWVAISLLGVSFVKIEGK